MGMAAARSDPGFSWIHIEVREHTDKYLINSEDTPCRYIENRRRKALRGSDFREEMIWQKEEEEKPMNILDWMITFGGIYLIYAALAMKLKGKIVKSIVANPEVDIEKIRDKEGFIQYMWVRVLILGIMSSAVGAVGIIYAQKGASLTTYMISFFGYLIVLVWYCVIYVRGRKRYME